MAQAKVNPRVSPLKNGFISLFSKKSLVVLFVLSLASCTSDPDFFGEDLIPNQDKLGLEMDTSFVISAYTRTTDTLYTPKTTTAMLGVIRDDVFGLTKADFVMEFAAPVLKNYSFGEAPVADSLIISFRKKGLFGTKESAHSISVYELSDTLRTKSPYNVIESMEGKFKPEVVGQSTYSGDSLLTIKLSSSLAQRLILADTATMKDNEKFKNFFKGLYFTIDNPESSSNSIYSFDLGNGVTHMKMYYHNAADDSLSASYISSVTKYNKFKHDYTFASESKKIHFLNDTVNQDSVFYLQGLAGTYAMLKLDDIQKWIKSMPVVINRAELIIEREKNSVLDDDSIVSNISIYMPLDEDRSNKTVQAIVDASNPFASTFGGTFVASKNHYSFNITLHLQQLLTRDITNSYLILEPTKSLIDPKGVVLRSGKHSRRIRLALTYTKL